jgi:hypothetical protein
MLRIFSILALGVLLAACASTDQTLQPASSMPPSGPSAAEVEQAAAFVRKGLPFPVEIDPFGAIFDSSVSESELVNLKRKFLEPLAQSPHAGKIKTVTIDASSLEWSQWTCRVELDNYMNPISITHFGGFYDGKSNTDPDAYRSSRPYVLNQLDNIAKRAGW